VYGDSKSVDYLPWLLSAFLVEAPSVSEHKPAVAFSVEIGKDYASVLGRKGDMLFGRYEMSKEKSC